MSESILKEILGELKSFKARIEALEAAPKERGHNHQHRFPTNGINTWEGRSRVFHKGGYYKGRAQPFLNNNTHRYRPVQRNESNHTRGTTVDPNIISEEGGPGNPIDALSTLLFRSCQLKHHLLNWQNLPNTLNKQFDILFKNIVPPMPSDKLKNDLQTLNDDCKSKLVCLILDHINTCQTEIKKRLSQAQGTDFDEAGVKARSQLLAHYRRKLTSNGINEWLAEDLQIVERGGFREDIMHIPIVVNNGNSNGWTRVKNTGKRPASSTPPTPPNFESENLFMNLIEEENLTSNSTLLPGGGWTFPPS